MRTGYPGVTPGAVEGNIYQRIAKVVNSRFENAESNLKGRFERFYRYEKMLQMISKRKTFEWKANAYLPYALVAAEQSAAMKYLTMFGSRPWVSVTPRQGGNGIEDTAARRQALLDWHFLGDIDLLSTGAEMFRLAERYGKAIAIVQPDWDMKKLRYRQAVNLPTVYGPIARMTWKTSQERAYSIRFEPVDNVDIFVPKGFSRINGRGGMPWIIRRYYLTLDDVTEFEALSMWGPQVGGQSSRLLKDTNQQEMSEYKARRLYLDRYEDFSHFDDKFDKVIEVLEYQGVVPRELIDPQLGQIEERAGLDPRHRLMIVANRSIVGFNQALPWDHEMKGYIEMDCIPNPHDFWGTGKVEPIEHLVYVGNEIMNMRIDNVKAAINGLIGIDGSRMPPGWKRRLVSQPWGVVETQGPPGTIIERLQLGDVTSSSYQEQQQVFSLIQEADAVNETMIGAPGGAVRTLGEHQMKTEGATKRLNFELWTQGQQLLGWSRKRPGLVYFIFGLDRQYLPLPQYFNIIDPMTPDEFSTLQLGAADLAADDENFIYQVTGTSEGMSKQTKRADFVQLTTMLAPLMQAALMGGFNVIEYIKTGLRVFDFDPNKFFPPMIGGMAQAAVQMPMPGAGAPGEPGGQQGEPRGAPGMQPAQARPGPVEGRNQPGYQAKSRPRPGVAMRSITGGRQ